MSPQSVSETIPLDYGATSRRKNIPRRSPDKQYADPCILFRFRSLNERQLDAESFLQVLAKNFRFKRIIDKNDLSENEDSDEDADDADASDADREADKRPKFQHVGAKTCTSCGTINTPVWRPMRNGIPLCNACGIRYKKGYMRCPRCKYFLNKHGRLCGRCGNGC